LPRFFFEGELLESSKITLPIKTTRHLCALRIRIGEDVELFNGDGYKYLAKLLHLDKKTSIVEILNKTPIILSNKVAIKLAMCIIANDKMDLVIQKSVELGVQEIIPIISERTQRIGDDKIDKKIAHWNNIIISSCEQCGNNVLPQIALFQNFNDLLNKYEHSYSIKKTILSPHLYNLPDKNILKANFEEVLLLVGPEGGFSDVEVKNAIEKGFSPLTLGKLVMRAETAAIASIVLANSQFNNW
jgi:16S rRNA (uracil1498-N3)-methyltransferase